MGGFQSLLFLFLSFCLILEGPRAAIGTAVAEELGRAFTLLVIETATGSHAFQVELAASGPSRERGLMFRHGLAPDHGMLFDYGTPSVVAMWMKNTLIPLDMIFIDDQGRVATLFQGAVPGSLRPIPSGGPVRAVLEVPGGTIARLEISVGDRVRHAIFGDRLTPP